MNSILFFLTSFSSAESPLCVPLSLQFASRLLFSYFIPSLPFFTSCPATRNAKLLMILVATLKYFEWSLF